MLSPVPHVYPYTCLSIVSGGGGGERPGISQSGYGSEWGALFSTHSSAFSKSCRVKIHRSDFGCGWSLRALGGRISYERRTGFPFPLISVSPVRSEEAKEGKRATGLERRWCTRANLEPPVPTPTPHPDFLGGWGAGYLGSFERKISSAL